MVSRGLSVACRLLRRDCFCESAKFIARNDNQGAFLKWDNPLPPTLDGNENFNRIVAAGFWTHTYHANTPRKPFFKGRVIPGVVEYVDSEFSNSCLENLNGVRRKDFQAVMHPISIFNKCQIGNSNAYRIAVSRTLLLKRDGDNGHHRIAKHVFQNNWTRTYGGCRLLNVQNRLRHDSLSIK